MIITIHHYHHFTTAGECNEVLRALDQLTGLAKQNQEKIMSSFDELKVQVEANRTVAQSAITLINGIADRIAAAGGDPVKLAELTASLKADDDALAAAVTANTPAA
jgi:hypothetical protein